MAIDMPPEAPSAYVIEVAKPSSIMTQRQTALSRSAFAAKQGSGKALMTPGDLAKNLPQLDRTPETMSREDRLALVGAFKDVSRENVRPTNLPNSYVGNRIRLSYQIKDMASASRKGIPVTPGEAHALRCKIVAHTMDARAGKHVIGGEKAAREARSTITQAMLNACKDQVQRVAKAPDIGKAGRVAPGIRQPVVSGLSGPVTHKIPQAQQERVVINPGHKIMKVVPQAKQRVKVIPHEKPRQVIPIGNRLRASLDAAET